MPNAGDYVRASDTTRYYCKATQLNPQSFTTAVFTAIQFDGTDDVDSLAIHDPVTNNSRLTIGLKLGWWQVSGKFVMAWTAATQGRRARWVINGTTGVNGGYIASPSLVNSTGSNAGLWSLETSTLVRSTLSTDYVELQGYQDSGGSLNTNVSGDLRCQAFAVYLGA